nr:MAG TPA: hypothetical protein [Caudoviricetes sp.]
MLLKFAGPSAGNFLPRRSRTPSTKTGLYYPDSGHAPWVDA